LVEIKIIHSAWRFYLSQTRRLARLAAMRGIDHQSSLDHRPQRMRAALNNMGRENFVFFGLLRVSDATTLQSHDLIFPNFAAVNDLLLAFPNMTLFLIHEH
jgi:hypothetical protein